MLLYVYALFRKVQKQKKYKAHKASLEDLEDLVPIYLLQSWHLREKQMHLLWVKTPQDSS